MTTDQYKRADQIAKQLSELYKYLDQLKAVEAGEIHQFQIECLRNDQGYPTFKIGHNSSPARYAGDLPESVQIIMAASAVVLRIAFEKEIEKLEKEFESL